jgi:fatty acid desaturase
VDGIRTTAEVSEPFASDPRFWRSVAASADAAAALVAATAMAILAALTFGAVWSVLPFPVPLVLLVRAGVTGVASARDSRAVFGPEARHGWRDAERHAVAHVFFPVLLRAFPRRSMRGVTR